MSGERLAGAQFSYIEQLNPSELLRLVFQLGREAGLAEAKAREAGVNDERERRAKDARRIGELLDAHQRLEAETIAGRNFWEDTRGHVAAVSTPNMTVYVDPSADAEAVAEDVTQLWTVARTPDPQPSKEPEMAAEAPPKPAKSPGRLKHGSHLVGDHTTVTYTKEQEKHRPGRIGDVVMVTAAGRQVEIRLTPSGRKAKVYVDGTEIQSA